MTTSTPNLGLVLYNSTTDSAEYFSNFRAVIAGTSLSSNFYKIDTAYGSMQTEIDDIQAGAYFTLASYISANYYEATVTGITAYNIGMKIILSLDTASAGTVTLNINSLGIKSVMKINTAGTPVNISAGELMVGKYYFFAYDGTRWVWVEANSSDQIYIPGTSGNVVTVNSDNTLLGTTTQSLLISSTIHSAASKATPVDADEIPLIDSAASNVLKSLTWANLKATLLTYFYTIFPKKDGWIEVSDSWTYATANTINIPSGGALIYKKGMGIRIKQGGAYKYYSGTIVADTLLTVTGGSEYVVANAAITDIAYTLTPSTALGFPVTFDVAAPTWNTGTIDNGTGGQQPTAGSQYVKIDGNIVKLFVFLGSSGVVKNGTGGSITMSAIPSTLPSILTPTAGTLGYSFVATVNSLGVAIQASTTSLTIYTSSIPDNASIAYTSVLIEYKY